MSFGQFNIYQPSTQSDKKVCSLNLRVGELVEVDSGVPEQASFCLPYKITTPQKSCFSTVAWNVFDANAAGCPLSSVKRGLNTRSGAHVLEINIDTNDLVNGEYILQVVFGGLCANDVTTQIVFTVGRALNIIYLTGDQLFNYQLFPQSVLDTLGGYKKWKSKVQLDFLSHQIAGSPCSPSRTSMYTGQHPSTAKVSDNTNVTYQEAMPAINEGGTNIYDEPLSTMGTLLDNYRKRYVGKFHISTDLDFRINNKPVPTWNTRNVLEKYDLGEFNPNGDPCYYPHVAYWNDQMATEMNLPFGTRGDYKDEATGTTLSGAIPFLKANAGASSSPWLLMINYEGSHDIMYYWANIEREALVTTLQANQYPRNSAAFNQRQQILGDTVDDVSTIFDIRDFDTSLSIYDNDVTAPFPRGILFSESFDQDFVGESTINSFTPDNYLVYSLGVDYLFTGLEKSDVAGWKAYQQMYFNVTRQMDHEFERIYDEIERLNMWNKVAVVITADHGEMNGAHGLRNKLVTPYKETLNVPLMIYSPNLTTKKEVRSITSHINIVPTILTLAGKTIPSNLGASLLKENALGRLELAPVAEKALFVCTSFMGYLGFFVSRVLPDALQTSYPIPEPKSVILNQVTAINSKLVSDNVFNYAGMVAAIVMKYAGVNYKFIRFFSLNAVLQDTVQLLIDNGMITTVLDSGVFNAAQKIAILAYPTTNVLTLPTKIDLLVQITDLVNGFFANPGLGKGFSTLILPDAAGDTNYQFQCFNMDEDTAEVINLADPIRQAANLPLLTALNSELDDLIVAERTDRLFISLPTDRLATFNITGESMGSTVLNYWLATIRPSDDTRKDVFASYIGPFDDGANIEVPARRPV